MQQNYLDDLKVSKAQLTATNIENFSKALSNF